MKFIVLFGTMAFLILLGQDKSAPDNTRINERDRAKGSKTADQQNMNETDRTLTQKIRKAVYDDKTLSTYAHNVKIISQDGLVTLRGPVKTVAEKETIANKAMSIAGKGKVTNELEVVAPPKS